MAEKNPTGMIKGCSRRTRPNHTLHSLIKQLRKEVLLQTGTNEKEKKKRKKSYSLFNSLVYINIIKASSICEESQEMQRKFLKMVLSLLDDNP